MTLIGVWAAVINITFITKEIETQTRIRQLYFSLNMQVCTILPLPQGCSYEVDLEVPGGPQGTQRARTDSSFDQVC